METNPFRLPSNISHEIDLTGLTSAKRDAHHIKQLRSVARWQGLDGVNDYIERHPDARNLRTEVSPTVYAPKPKGYSERLASIVNMWCISDVALNETNRADVGRLNSALGTAYNPNNHFSKALSAACTKRIAATLGKHGIHLDTDNPVTMSKVRKIVRTFKTGGPTEHSANGRVYARTGDVVAIGSQTFKVERHNSRECIRVTVNGTRRRMDLEALELVLSGLVSSRAAGEPSSYLLHSNIGELAPISETVPADADPLERGANSPQQSPDCGANSPELSPTEHQAEPDLAERIRRLRSRTVGKANSASALTGDDPLEFN